MSKTNSTSRPRKRTNQSKIVRKLVDDILEDQDGRYTESLVRLLNLVGNPNSPDREGALLIALSQALIYSERFTGMISEAWRGEPRLRVVSNDK